MVYIYEYIRTRGCEPLHFEEHYNRLEELSRNFQSFALADRFPREMLRQRIVEQLKREGYYSTATNAVCVKIPPHGNEPIIDIEEIFYNDFALRAVRPQGYTQSASGELILQNTSARMALIEFNRMESQAADEGVAIWVNDQKEVLAIDGAAAVAVFDNEIRFSNFGNSVEFEVVYDKLSSVRKNVTRGSIFEEDLKQAKEVLGIDYRGIVALESFSSHHYMDITAEKIISLVNEAEQI
jgi:hypothetical protein